MAEILVMLILHLLSAANLHHEWLTQGPLPGERIYEDDPRWDCRTMGNMVCGPITISG